ncbi:MAG: GNAT family N-acetyltransferase [Gemmatimonadota bacterium]
MPTIAPLASHRNLVPLLAAWFIAEWPEWYGPGGRGDALADLTSFAASASTLPVGLVALVENEPVGVAALKPESLPSHRHLGPWAAAGFVLPTYRGTGIGGSLLDALVARAGELGYPRVYCGTATATSLLRRSGWSELEFVRHEGEDLVIFAKETAG